MSVRRVVGVATVAFLLSCAVVFYLVGSGFLTSGSGAGTTANPSARPAPSTVGHSQGEPSGGGWSTAGASRSADPESPGWPTAGDNTGSPGSAGEETIQVQALTNSAKPFQTVRIQGTYRGGADTFLWVQRWEGGSQTAGKWTNFPVPTKTDQSGQFTAHVELGMPGSHQLRVLDPDAGVASQPFVLVIEADTPG
ncbi:MAG TPA: hypothetical protein VNT27_17665 [Propionibacteriaceae bacterium]|nr:hypothetical protein [Propionibacteriaceae bacterium]